ncbi:MAG: 50S ribosomal protein L4 [Bacillota bacterium]|jgi:large subunit ribosomal protein L4|uniref:Large ribosomal subunit protein uL4 n=1 Tax=Thermanaerosceptrum fracticalcis TaxID=1712410 RepID=A0A7G6E5U0_THEFR|nr:50S ribosomal protein L4 [Thermanaerosceptrum fracticalcis]QNB47444.1 50S ribosomal protein L4 [Thermanaerosceptrum fracticalcis]
MPKVAIYNVQGAQVGEMELNDEIFGIEPNEAVVHEAVVMQLASLRRGTHATKTRAEVRGGGRKPWRQKGTGRARAGTIRSPLWRKGGIVFGPKPRDYAYSIPRKKRRLAIKSVLSSKVNTGDLIVLDNLTLAAPKTKEMVQVLNNLKVDKKALIVTVDNETNVERSARNIAGVKPLAADGINVYDLLNHDKLIITKDAIAKVEEVWA